MKLHLLRVVIAWDQKEITHDDRMYNAESSTRQQCHDQLQNHRHIHRDTLSLLHTCALSLR